MESEKKINDNGHKYVDLDLPSGTLWATMNVGASKPSESGLYFQWGDTIGYRDSQVGYGCGQTEFTWKYYKWNLGGDGKTFTKYTTAGATLELEDDVARANMGGEWHIPTPEQIRELIDNTTSTWKTLDGVNGRKFTSRKDKSKFIFIPAVGFAKDSSVINSGSCGNVWASVLDTRYIYYSLCLTFGPVGTYLGNGFRNCGFSVRGVIG